MSKTQKNDFVELLYTGYSNGKVFDSNIPEDLRKLDPKATPKKTIVVIGQGMVVPGLDKAIEDKEIGKEYEIKLTAKEGFGERNRELLKTIPLKVFTERNIAPQPGMVLALDDSLAKIVTVSGARVITDFNNPLAGKEISYKFSITRIITDDKERTAALFENTFRFVPEFDVTDKQVILKGEKNLEIVVKAFKDKVKEILNKELTFTLVEKKKDSEKADDKKPQVTTA